MQNRSVLTYRDHIYVCDWTIIKKNVCKESWFLHDHTAVSLPHFMHLMAISQNDQHVPFSSYGKNDWAAVGPKLQQSVGTVIVL